MAGEIPARPAPDFPVRPARAPGRRFPSRPAALCSSILVAAALGAAPAALGPRDGRDLPPYDLNRVRVGTRAPDFTLESLGGDPVTLSQFRGKKRVVLVFYRGQW